MKKMVLLLMITGSVCWIACDKELDITDFEDEFGNYQPELKIEGLLRLDKPEDSIIRIIRTSSITDKDVYDGRDDDGDGRIDEYDEVLALIQDTTATVIVRNLSSGDIFDFHFVAEADSFTSELEEETHTHSVSHSHEGTDEDEHTYEHTHTLTDVNAMVRYGGYKPLSEQFRLEAHTQYQLEVYSTAFDLTVTGLTTVYPQVDFIDTLHAFQDDFVILDKNKRKEVFWKSDLDVTAYYISLEALTEVAVDEWESEFLYSHRSSRDNNLTKKYQSVSVGREFIWFADEKIVTQLTVHALSPEYGQYLFSSLPLNDPQKTNLRDQNGNPVMGCFGATAAKSLFIVTEN